MSVWKHDYRMDETLDQQRYQPSDSNKNIDIYN